MHQPTITRWFRTGCCSHCFIYKCPNIFICPNWHIWSKSNNVFSKLYPKPETLCSLYGGGVESPDKILHAMWFKNHEITPQPLKLQQLWPTERTLLLSSYPCVLGGYLCSCKKHTSLQAIYTTMEDAFTQEVHTAVLLNAEGNNTFCFSSSLEMLKLECFQQPQWLWDTPLWDISANVKNCSH